MALRQYDWTERSQAKWYLRDMLGDYARGIPHSIFTAIDMHYPDFVLHKGLLASTADKRVDHPKQSYFAVQNAVAIFDDSFERMKDVTCHARLVAAEVEARGKAREKNPIVFYAFRKKGGQQSLVTLWHGGQRPAHEFPMLPMNITCTGIVFHDPVFVDLLSGRIYDIPKEHQTIKNGSCVFRGIPVYDSPVLLIERSIIRSQVSPHGRK
jgi:hypothetical protein